MLVMEEGLNEKDIRRRTKMVAYVAVMTALGTVFLLLGTFIGINTVFFTALASYLVGIIAVEYGLGASIMHYFGCAVLDALLNPNKFHVFLFLGMGAFILIAENTYRFFEKKIPERVTLTVVHYLFRAGIFAAVYIPLILLLPELFLSESIYGSSYFYLVATIAGVIGFFVFDKAYVILKSIYLRTFKNRL